MTTLFSHPRQPRRHLASAAPAAQTRPQRRPSAARTANALERPDLATLHLSPVDPVPSFIPPTPHLDLRPPAATWDAIASTSRELRRAAAASVPTDIAVLGTRARLATRAFDLVAATILLTLTLPLMALAGLAVALTSRGPALYVSWRLGRGGTLFACLKIRTMHRDADAQLLHLLAANPRLAAEYRASNSLANDPRATAVGRILRRTHLDELPQLFNVLGGTMSLVGPRPIVPKEMEYYGAALTQTLTVKPGITGAWQVSKRLGGYPGRVEADLRYVQRRNLFADLWISARTALMVIGVGRRAKR